MTTWAEAATLFQAVDSKFTAWTEAQQAAHDLWTSLDNHRMLLFYPTGKGKTKTALALMADAGFKKIIVVAPPKTHGSWIFDATTLGLELVIMSVQKFRDKKYKVKLPRDTPIIADEYHLFGGHNGEGFKRLDRMSEGFPAILLASATPEYNDAERAYCTAHVLDPLNNRGGYLQWIYDRCETRVNPFASTPYVDGFIDYEGAAEFLIDQGYTAFLEDDAEWIEEEFVLPSHTDEWFEKYNYDRYTGRMIASGMEKDHRRIYLSRVDPDTELLWPDVKELLIKKLNTSTKPWLLFCQHSTIAEVVDKSLEDSEWLPVLITGGLSDTLSEARKRAFIQFDYHRKVLIGTGTLATGVDGIDKVSNQLMIFDDINGDHAQRRQLIGRVLPRGTGSHETLVMYARTTE